MRLIKSSMNKVCSSIEQKGVAQLLQIEEVRLKSSRRCGFNQSPHAQEASILLVFLHSLRHTLLGSICCMQRFLYLEEVSKHCQSYLQRSVTRKMAGKYRYTTIAHKRKRIKKIPTYLLKILTCSII